MTATPPPRLDLPSLLEACIEHIEAGEQAAADALLAAHVEIEADAREALHALDAAGLLARAAPGGAAIDSTTDGGPRASAAPRDSSGASTASDTSVATPRARTAAGVAAVEHIGPYRLVRPLGSGGMGVVWFAVHGSLGRTAAVKLMRGELARSPTAVERFRREARALARLDHPGIVTLYDAGEHDGTLWTAMALVPGCGLDEWARVHGRPPAVRAVLDWGVQIADALHAAHEAGIVHRDVKPSNVRVTPEGRALLLDFGLARDADAATLTVSGAFAGSPAYAAPEQIAGDRAAIGPRTDVYALGVTLYELLTGRAPFEGTTEAVFHRVLAGDVAPVRRLAPHVSRDLATVIEKAIETDHARRYANAAALAEDLRAVLELRPVTARGPGAWRRARRWAHRHRATSLTVGAALVVVLALLVARAIENRREATEARRLAHAAIVEARDALDHLADTRDEWAALGRTTSEDAARMRRAYHDAESWRDHDLDVARRATLSRERAVAFRSAEEAIERARRLDPAARSIAALELELELERWRTARAAGEMTTVRELARTVAALDVDGTHADEIALRGALSLTVTPADAQIELFRYEPRSQLVPGAEPRLVAVPAFGPLPELPPGTWALRPSDPAPPLEPADLIVEVAGHPVEGAVFVATALDDVPRHARLVAVDRRSVTEFDDVLRPDRLAALPPDSTWTFDVGDRRVSLVASDPAALGAPLVDARGLLMRGDVDVTVWRAGRRLALHLDAPIRAVPTASPLLGTPENTRFATPLDRLALTEGHYLARITREGSAPARVPFDVEAGRTTTVATELPDVAVGPPGFVPVTPEVDGVASPFWLQEREVTCGEYLRFLADPTTVAQLRRATTPMLYPRNSASPGPSYFPTDADGDYTLAPPLLPDCPVFGVSLIDAKAYAAWLTDRARAAGDPWTFTVPTLAEVDAVRRVSRHRPWTFGAEFRPAWLNGYWSRSSEWLAPVLHDPVDELPHGVFAIGGGVSEWTTTPGVEGLVRIYGGAFTYTEAVFFGTDFTSYELPTLCSSAIGFRLVARRAD